MTKSLLYGAGAMLLALALGACSHPATTAPPPPEVSVMSAEPGNTPLTLNLVGRLSAYRSADINARVAGVLLKRDYKEGSEVKAGQLLFRIDPAPFKAALDNATAQLAQAQATYANDRVNAQRARAMAPKGYISQSDLDTAIAAERTAHAAVQAAQANVETARINLGYTRVTSPIAGRADEQQVTEGALVGQGSATLLTTVSQLNPLYVNFTISVAELDELRQAQSNGGVRLNQPDKATVQISLPNGSVYPESGVVDFSSPTVDPVTASVKLRAVLPNPQFTLLPGSYVNLKVSLGERHNVFLIPQAAVQRDITGAYVLVVGKDGKVARHGVTTNGTQGLDWIVTSGLAANDRVIVLGIQAVHVGERANPMPWQPLSPAGSPATGIAAASADATDGK